MSAASAGRSARIRQAIVDAGRPLTAPEVAEAIGDDATVVSQTMSMMFGTGILTREGSPRTFRYSIGRVLRRGGRSKQPPVPAEDRRARDRERSRQNLIRDAEKIEQRRQQAAVARKAAAVQAAGARMKQAQEARTLAQAEPETVAAFEARGGRIQRLAPGECSRPLRAVTA
ncbi:MAG: hypothetical protein OJK14_15980 [Achromobacter sp.]|uniref:hypothetical protein n=1 Tax=Achromobacter sp. TaxID=134375 RepID=UPI0025883C26|nr:hypothetical protein [Achromobacter sp.]MCW0208598.1 hypothetical protein [Achromobacter sp.]